MTTHQPDSLGLYDYAVPLPEWLPPARWAELVRSARAAGEVSVYLRVRHVRGDQPEIISLTAQDRLRIAALPLEARLALGRPYVLHFCPVCGARIGCQGRMPERIEGGMVIMGTLCGPCARTAHKPFFTRKATEASGGGRARRERECPDCGKPLPRRRRFCEQCRRRRRRGTYRRARAGRRVARATQLERRMAGTPGGGQPGGPRNAPARRDGCQVDGRPGRPSTVARREGGQTHAPER